MIQEFFDMSAREWLWLLAYCFLIGVPTFLVLTRPSIGVPLGVVTSTLFFCAIQRQTRCA